MAAPIDSPVLDATLRRVAERARRRRRNAALLRAAWAGAAAAAIVAGWHVWDRLQDVRPLPLAAATGLVAATALVAAVARLVRGDTTDEVRAAREIDRRLGLDDRTSAALAVARGGSASRLAEFVVRDAEETLRIAAPRVEAAFPQAPPAASWRPLRSLAYVAAALIALAVFLDFVWIGVRGGIWPGRPAPGGEPSPEAAAVADSPQREGGTPGPGPVRPSEPPPPQGAHKDDTTAPAPGDVRVAIRPSKQEFAADEPVTVTVSAAPTGELAGPRTYDVRVAVDGIDVDTGSELTVNPSVAPGSGAEIDLRKVPGLKLPAGEHEVRARLTTRTTHEDHASAPARFRIRPPKDETRKDEGGDGKKPKPKPPEPQPKEPPPPQPGDPKRNEKQPPPPQGALPPPPPLDRHVVVPLFGEGDEVKKKGVVLVIDPSGGTATPQARRPLDDVLTDARRRAEDAVDSARVPAADRDLVRRYFELLEALRR